MPTESAGRPQGQMKIGVVMPIAEDDERRATPGYAEIRGIALQCEAAAFDSIWVFDHLLFRFPDQPTAGIWEIWTILSALSEATARVQLGTLVMCVPFRNPALLAKMAGTLDEVSGGRLILGLGAGWHKPEFDAFGAPFDHRVERFEEALRIIVPLLRERRVDFSHLLPDKSGSLHLALSTQDTRRHTIQERTRLAG
ncbi:MAG TPA: LLM class flavin-dependent oxidoreductase [Roseiflexaceae bacterium]